MKPSAREFFGFARAREQLRMLRSRGEPAPWTEDRVLRDFRFCNVFREDDATTIWFREHVRDPWSQRVREAEEGASREEYVQCKVGLAVATTAFRWFNYVETGNAILETLLGHWSRDEAERALRPIQRAGGKLFTGAYLIKSPPKLDKLTGILDCIDGFASVAEDFVKFSCTGDSLEWAHGYLVHRVSYLGRFMAYEVVTDLRHTPLLENATDKDTWASAGPGCARGISWIMHGHPDGFSYAARGDQLAMLGLMRELLEQSRDPRHWPERWPRWELREVEHTLCEFDKWKRGHAGQSLKRRFGSGGQGTRSQTVHEAARPDPDLP